MLGTLPKPDLTNDRNEKVAAESQSMLSNRPLAEKDLEKISAGCFCLRPPFYPRFMLGLVNTGIQA